MRFFSRPVLLALTVGALLVIMVRTDRLLQSEYKYSTVTGYFLQDDALTDPGSFDYVSLQ